MVFTLNGQALIRDETGDGFRRVKNEIEYFSLLAEYTTFQERRKKRVD